MKKQDWLDYFEAVNGRSPEAHEVETALLAGEFHEENGGPVGQQAPQAEAVQPQQVAPAETVVNPQVEQTVAQQAPQNEQSTAQQTQQQYAQAQTQTQQNAQFQQMQEQFSAFQQSEQVQNLKAKTGNYFNWLVTYLKDPTSATNGSNFNFSLITLVLSALFLGGALLNFIRRILFSYANITVSGRVLKTE